MIGCCRVPPRRSRRFLNHYRLGGNVPKLWSVVLLDGRDCGPRRTRPGCRRRARRRPPCRRGSRRRSPRAGASRRRGRSACRRGRSPRSGGRGEARPVVQVASLGHRPQPDGPMLALSVLAAHDISARVVGAVANLGGVLNAVRAGLGVALVACAALPEGLVELADLPPAPPVTGGLVSPQAASRRGKAPRRPHWVEGVTRL